MDRQTGELLDQLEADGLAEDTIVFYYSDHGMGMPRGKRVLQDSGLRVPLLIRFPEKWRHLAPSAPGTTDGRLVSFVDFPPTVLNLIGLDIPGHFQGRAFLGKNTPPPRKYVHAARDRVDEAFDLSRSVRDERWLYIRNFMPHLSWMQPEAYSDTSTFRREFRKMAAAGELSPGPMTFAAPTRSAEELYDTLTDPDQLHNLAADPAQQPRLAELREELRRWQMETRDAGFFTEPQMWSRLADGDTPFDVARDDHRYPLARLLDTAGQTGHPSPVFQRTLDDPLDALRYWAALGLHSVPNISETDRSALRKALNDPDADTRIEAAATLAAAGDPDPALGILAAALDESGRPEIILHAARQLELLGATAAPGPRRHAGGARLRPQARGQGRSHRHVHPLQPRSRAQVSRTTRRPLRKRPPRPSPPPHPEPPNHRPHQCRSGLYPNHLRGNLRPATHAPKER